MIRKAIIVVLTMGVFASASLIAYAAVSSISRIEIATPRKSLQDRCLQMGIGPAGPATRGSDWLFDPVVTVGWGVEDIDWRRARSVRSWSGFVFTLAGFPGARWRELWIPVWFLGLAFAVYPVLVLTAPRVREKVILRQVVAGVGSITLFFVARLFVRTLLWIILFEKLRQRDQVIQWLTTGAGLAACAIYVRVSARQWLRHPPGHCQRCGYNLTGNVSGVCPECGTDIPKGVAIKQPDPPPAQEDG